jgi:hypothetical protein
MRPCESKAGANGEQPGTEKHALVKLPFVSQTWFGASVNTAVAGAMGKVLASNASRRRLPAPAGSKVT